MILFLRAINSALGVIPGLAWFVLLFLALSTAAVERHQKTVAQTALTAEKARSALIETQRMAVALDAEQKERAIETERNSHAAQIVAVVTGEQAKTKSAVSAAIAVTDKRVRDELTAYASGSGQASGDSQALTDSRQRAATLASLLTTCRIEGKSDAGELEDLATQVRGLRAAYHSLE